MNWNLPAAWKCAAIMYRMMNNMNEASSDAWREHAMEYIRKDIKHWDLYAENKRMHKALEEIANQEDGVIANPLYLCDKFQRIAKVALGLADKPEDNNG
jgi:hypothetical protein